MQVWSVCTWTQLSARPTCCSVFRWVLYANVRAIFVLLQNYLAFITTSKTFQDWVKILSIQCSPISERSQLYWKVPSLRPFVLLTRATCWSIWYKHQLDIRFDIFPTRCNFTPFIYFWKTVLHVSGGIFTHHQEHI